MLTQCANKQKPSLQVYYCLWCSALTSRFWWWGSPEVPCLWHCKLGSSLAIPGSELEPRNLNSDGSQVFYPSWCLGAKPAEGLISSTFSPSMVLSNHCFKHACVCIFFKSDHFRNESPCHFHLILLSSCCRAVFEGLCQLLSGKTKPDASSSILCALQLLLWVHSQRRKVFPEHQLPQSAVPPFLHFTEFLLHTVEKI